MLVYGVSVAVGNIWGGKMADKMGPIKALTVIFSGLAAVLVVFNFTAVNPYASVATILVWGAFAFGNVPGLQVYVVKLAEKYTPDAVDVASGLNIAAFNVGIALGSWGGGIIVAESGLNEHTLDWRCDCLGCTSTDSIQWSARQETDSASRCI